MAVSVLDTGSPFVVRRGRGWCPLCIVGRIQVRETFAARRALRPPGPGPPPPRVPSPPAHRVSRLIPPLTRRGGPPRHRRRGPPPDPVAEPLPAASDFPHRLPEMGSTPETMNAWPLIDPACFPESSP